MNKQSTFFSPRNISKRYIIDNLILRVFYSKNDNNFIKNIEKVFEMEGIKNVISYNKIIFDESIWFPEDITSYGNIIKIIFQINGNIEYTELTLDLRKNIDDYINHV